MSERPTPETERVKSAYHTNWDDIFNHARKLERERDEARDQADKYLAILKKHNLEQHGN